MQKMKELFNIKTRVKIINFNCLRNDILITDKQIHKDYFLVRV